MVHRRSYKGFMSQLRKDDRRTQEMFAWAAVRYNSIYDPEADEKVNRMPRSQCISWLRQYFGKVDLSALPFFLTKWDEWYAGEGENCGEVFW